jgi:predicted nucleic acid-binding protein
MQVREVRTTIEPGKIEKRETNINDFESLVLSHFTKLEPKYYGLYDTYSARNNTTLLKDLLNNIEKYVKSKNINEAETLLTISRIFETVKIQFSILEDLKINNIDSNEIQVIFCSTIISHLKRILS